MPTHTSAIVVGLFADGVSAETSVADLKLLGVADERIGIVIADAGTYELVTDRLPAELKGMAKGAAVGGVFGSFAGIALSARMAGPLGLVVGGMLASAALSGGMGVIAGTYSGLALQMQTGPDHYCHVPIGGSHYVVAVQAGDDAEDAEEVRNIFVTRGARCFGDQLVRRSELVGNERAGEAVGR